MYTILRAASLTLALLLAFTAQAAHVPGRLLVKTRGEASESRFQNRLVQHRAVQTTSINRLNVRLLTLPESRVEAALAQLRADPDVEFAERDFLARAAFVPNDAWVVSGQEWHLATIQAPQAWNHSVGRVTVAVLDSGVNRAHPDLLGRVLNGYDFVEGDNDPADDFGHGTAVAGVVAAAGNNRIGVAGVAYGCSILPVKVAVFSGFAAYSDIAQGIRYAVDRGARVINISISGDSPSHTLQSAIDYAWTQKVLVVAAAGNNASGVPQYPAACAHVVAVSATDATDGLAPFSNYGPHVKVAAPGDNIWTTQSDLTRPYAAWRGTSFASPVAAAVAALIASVNPTLAPDDIASLLQRSADDRGVPGPDVLFGHGRVNAFRAVQAAMPAPPPSSAAPQVSLASPQNTVALEIGQSLPLLATVSLATGFVSKVEFLADGLTVAAAQSTPFAADWTPATPGTLKVAAVAWSAEGVASTSAPVTVRILAPDTIPPILQITRGPTGFARRTGSEMTLAGRARDNRGLDRVELQLNGNAFEPVTGTTNWTATVSLTPGTNIIRLRSVDLAGNVSRVLRRTVFYVVPALVQIQTNGLGRVQPDLNGRMLEIGRSYTVTAVPEPDQAFAGWTGATPEKTTLRFIMESNLVLVANFVPSPFPAVRGIYGGLVADTNGVLPETSGSISLQVTRRGFFTGTLVHQGVRRPFQGRFNLSGDASLQLRRAGATPLKLMLRLDLAPGLDRLNGELATDAWTSQIAADRDIFSPSMNPAPQAGRYRFALSQLTDLGPTNAVLLSTRITAGGSVISAGRFLDGRAFTASGILASTGDHPFYLSCRKGAETMIGWLNFQPPTPDLAPVGGSLAWVNTGTNGFAVTLTP